MRNEYSVANRVAGLKSRKYPVEIGAVVAIEPLAIQIGQAIYESTHWQIWVAYREEKNILEETIVGTGFDATGSADEHGVIMNPDIKLAKTDIKKAKADIAFAIGDRVAVQQMADEKSFIILGKVRRA